MKKEQPDKVLRGQMYYANLDPVIGSEQGGTRPVLVIQNDVGNCFSPTLIVAPITTRVKKADPHRYPAALRPTAKFYGHAGADQND